MAFSLSFLLPTIESGLAQVIASTTAGTFLTTTLDSSFKKLDIPLPTNIEPALVKVVLQFLKSDGSPDPKRPAITLQEPKATTAVAAATSAPATISAAAPSVATPPVTAAPAAPATTAGAAVASAVSALAADAVSTLATLESRTTGSDAKRTDRRDRKVADTATATTPVTDAPAPAEASHAVA